jgi:hypothetical protein
MSVILRSGIVATLGEFGDFEENTGGEKDAAVTDYYPAGANSPQKLFGPVTVTDITLTRAYDPTRDEPLVDWVERYLAGKDRPRAITVVARNAQGVVEKSRNYATCKPKGIKPPDGKSGDGSPAMISVTLAVENF